MTKSYDEITRTEAEEFLRDFLDTEGRILAETIRLRKSSENPLVISIDSMQEYFREFDSRVRPSYRPWRGDEKNFLTELPEHRKGKEIFSAEANMCLMRMGFFFGECLQRESDKLFWAVGKENTSDENQPVISGFKHEIECAPIVVCTNIVRRISSAQSDYDGFVRTFEAWLADIP